MSWRQKLETALESIDYQKSHLFFDELTMAVAELRRLPVNKNAVEIAGITKIIHAHTGLNVEGIYNPHWLNAGIMPPFIDAHSPLMTYLIEGLRVHTDDRPGLDHVKVFDTGTIDLEKGRVSGVFTKVESKLMIGAPYVDLLTDREVAAGILHEVGHVFAVFEYIAHTSTLAVNLNYCASQLAKTNNKQQHIKIIINTLKNLDIEVDDVETLADAKSPDTVVSVILESYTRRARSGTGASFYDYRSWEALADQFSTRQGAGRDAVTGLHKLDQAFGNYAKKGSFWNAMNYVVEILSVPLKLIFAAVPIIGQLYALNVLLDLCSAFPPEGLYDSPVERATRIKNELIGHLKDQTLLPEQQLEVQKSIASIDEVIAEVGKVDSLGMKVWRVLTSYRRKNYKQIEFQQELEKLANNELFLTASKFATLNTH